ncbi:hypothetical protein MMC30_003636 [Trapelia coarctata]|nr:hypothetical protein [Trapelia coarctata]
MPDLEDTYHWALTIFPKPLFPLLPFKPSTPSLSPSIHHSTPLPKRYHAKSLPPTPSKPMQWLYEEHYISTTPENMLLVLITIGKVTNLPHLEGILRGVPVVQGSESWNCVSWVKDALEALRGDGERERVPVLQRGLENEKALGTHILEWEMVRDASMRYCAEKRVQRRFDGKADFDMKRIPTFDLLERKETVN